MTTATEPAFTQGDPFNLPFWLRDTDPNIPLPPLDPERGIAIDDTVTVEGVVIDESGRKIADLTLLPYPTQDNETKGWGLLQALEPTDNWPVGVASIQVRADLGGGKRSTSVVYLPISRNLF